MDGTVWDSICKDLKESIPPHVYASLVAPVKCRNATPKRIELSFQDLFSKEGFEEKCLVPLQKSLEKMEISDCEIDLSVTDESGPPVQRSLFETELTYKNPFDGNHTFENFVIGSSNQFAHAACLAVSKQPGQCYNPLFIFGGAGLGKTHLLRAIGHKICKNNPLARVLFLTSESFTNELIQAIRVDRMREFREKYRSRCDVLLIDDVHFLAGKERTQEEFFYTFNYLHESRKQLVITSDRYPKDIQGLENRLQTRFEWGLVADVQPPETETRIAILKNKAEKDNIYLPDDVATYIASHITSNIRELEGTLHRLSAYASLMGATISVELAKQTLKDITPKARHELSPEAILKLVALQFNIRVVDLKSSKRTRDLTMPRQICMYLLRRHLVMSYPEIGRFLGGKDHTTVLHGVTKMANLMRTDPEILKCVTTIESLFR